ncbi:hypothetical protein [Microcoleus sp. herbarium2]|uniref:hypothetical protein n=1 Tax=Microcoleus sp. herbarium2 TaxID=3055433 RepID=UPI002FD5A27E
MRLRTLVAMKAIFAVECDFAIVLWTLWRTISLDGIPTEEHSTLKIEPPRYETARAPPRRFIPTPRIEIGGCARSDSLPAPAINGGAVSPML